MKTKITLLLLSFFSILTPIKPLVLIAVVSIILETAHKYAKLAYEQMGYEVVIDVNF